MSGGEFTKKIYTFKTLWSDIGFLFSHFKQIRGLSKNKDINKVFFEKIMSVVTAVNGCRYCEWFHAKQSLEAGMDTKEISDMFELQFHTSASEFELPALLYAQHYAETNRMPDVEMNQKLNEFYGEKTASDIRLIIRMIYFGNLTGNTFDAFLSRFKGQKAEGSSIVFEFFFFIFNAPFLLPILWILNRKK